MAFDPPLFEAQVALKLIPTEKLPSIAQDAMEAGFDGPCVVRMAILDPRDFSEIDQALPPMLAELGLQEIPAKDAALRVAICRAEKILASGEDPLPSLGYFYQLLVASDYAEELQELGWWEDNYPYVGDHSYDEQAQVVEALRVLVSPELRQKKIEERRAAYQQFQQEAEERRRTLGIDAEPWVGMRKDLLQERLQALRRLRWLLVILWAAVAWAFGSWRISLLGAVLITPMLLTIARWSVDREVKRKRRDQLLRMGIPEEQI